ncbi:MAG: hypothetical protein AAGC53_08095 [Actinomycetota bacterium]
MVAERFADFVDPVDGTRWSVDVGFLGSRWTCIWGNGCQGILETSTEHLGHGCCSVGTELLDDEESMLLSALAAMLDDDLWQYRGWADENGIYEDERRERTITVDGACVFLNRPGFEAGSGCALHLQALRDGDRPVDIKPSVCWQLPLIARHHGDGSATLRRWGRDDRGDDGAAMHWCCTEGDNAQVGDQPTADYLAAELQALVGPEVAVMIRQSVAEPTD